MKSVGSILLAVSAVSAQTAFLEPYSQCGGLTYNGDWECEPGYTCSPVGSNAFPDYQCAPNVGPVTFRVFPYGQCGGIGYTGPTLCTPGWTCVVMNPYFSNCDANANTTTPADPTPDLANPGSFCGESALERDYPTDCVPGFTCSGPGVFGYYVCLIDTGSSSSTVSTTTTTTTTVLTTLAISTSST